MDRADDLVNDILDAAAKAVETSERRGGGALDFSPDSLATVEEMLAEAAPFRGELAPDEIDTLVQVLGCYVSEVARKQFGGKYYWYKKREQPVLVVGEPTYRLALLTWDKIRGRLDGDEGNNIPFFYDGFANRARVAKAGDDAFFV